MTYSVRVAAVLLGILAALGLISCGGEKAAPEVMLRPVRCQQVFSTGGGRVRTFSGMAQAGVQSQLSFRIGGTVERLPVKVGDNVKPGDLIASLDQKDYKLQVEEANASLEQAQAQARNAAANYQRVRALYENRNASRNDLDAARAADESAKAAVESVTKRLELAQSQLSYTRLTAPVAGAIASVDCEVNENVKAGQRIALLTSGSRTEVHVTIPEVLIADVREGDAVSVSFDALPNRSFGAHITEVGVAATGMVTTFPVTVSLDQETDDVRPGMAAEVAFTFGSEDTRERFIVPPVAVGEDRSGRFVYVVTPDEPGIGLVHRRPVTIGDLSSDGLEVLTGISDGDYLLTAGVNKVHDGMKVEFTATQDAQP